MRAFQKFAVAEQRPDSLDCVADQLRKVQVEDIAMKSVWETAQESNMYISQCYVRKGEEPIAIAAGQRTVDEHLFLDVVQYEIEHLAVTRNNNADELFSRTWFMS